jgi:hypothetical protein
MKTLSCIISSSTISCTSNSLVLLVVVRIPISLFKICTEIKNYVNFVFRTYFLPVCRPIQKE